jgi:hypothetical protein
VVRTPDTYGQVVERAVLTNGDLVIVSDYIQPNIKEARITGFQDIPFAMDGLVVNATFQYPSQETANSREKIIDFF